MPLCSQFIFTSCEIIFEIVQVKKNIILSVDLLILGYFIKIMMMQFKIKIKQNFH